MDETLQDWEECEQLFQSTLTEQERKIVDGHPVWELDPPQREEYLTPRDYVNGLKEYANRVLASAK